MSPDPAALEATLALLRERLSGSHRRPFVLGLSGAQGSGKSTLAAQLAGALDRQGRSSAILSLDDLYLTRAERERLARDIHPLLLTRGVPGTHDVALGLTIMAALDSGKPVALPRFDKATDDRAPPSAWQCLDTPPDVLILEGWCVGVEPEPNAALAQPVNALEAREDADGRWRRYVNDALAGAYQQLFARIDALVLLAAPSFDVVLGWRLEQERSLRDELRDPEAGMDDGAIARFIQHYERLTRHALRTLPRQADLTLRLDEMRRIRSN